MFSNFLVVARTRQIRRLRRTKPKTPKKPKRGLKLRGKTKNGQPIRIVDIHGVSKQIVCRQREEQLAANLAKAFKREDAKPKSPRADTVVQGAPATTPAKIGKLSSFNYLLLCTNISFLEKKKW